MADSLASVMSLEDPSERVISGWASSLGALSQQTSQLSAAAAANVQSMAVEMVTLAASGDAGVVSYEVALPILDSVDSASTAASAPRWSLGGHGNGNGSLTTLPPDRSVVQQNINNQCDCAV
jgi:hypothetical protein